MGISLDQDTLIVYLDKQPYACCHDRDEALKLTSHLLGAHHPKRIVLLHV